MGLFWQNNKKIEEDNGESEYSQKNEKANELDNGCYTAKQFLMETSLQ